MKEKDQSMGQQDIDSMLFRALAAL